MLPKNQATLSSSVLTVKCRHPPCAAPQVLAELSTEWRWDEVSYPWLAWVMHELQRDSALSTHLPALRRLPLIPLMSGVMASSEQGTVYEVSEQLATELHSLRGQERAHGRPTSRHTLGHSVAR
jgi:hypothetical protein